MSLYRNTFWFLKGLTEYTRGGYQRTSKSFSSVDLEVDCSGQSFLITGANSGIGKALALDLAKRGATVHMLCRNEERALKAMEEIKDESGNNKLYLHIVDMSEPREVYRFAKEFSETQEPLHVLINNAGCMIHKREVNSEGMEKHFATNTLGVHILTTTLVPLLSKSVQPRVVILSSGGMLVQKLDIGDLQFERLVPFDGTTAYSQTKRQEVIMTEKYAEKYPGIHFSAVNPGWADTPGVQSAMSGFYQKMQNALRTAAEGADTALWLAISNAALKYPSGLFFLDRKPSSTHLPLAWTKSSPGDEDTLMETLDLFLETFRVP